MKISKLLTKHFTKHSIPYYLLSSVSAALLLTSCQTLDSSALNPFAPIPLSPDPGFTGAISAISLGGTTAQITWAAPTNPRVVKNFAIYELNNLDKPLMVLPKDLTSATLSGLTPNTLYNLIVRTICDDFTDQNFNIAQAYTYPGITTATISGTQAKVTFPANPAATLIKIEYCVDPCSDDNWTPLPISSDRSSVGFSVTTGIAYDFKVHSISPTFTDGNTAELSTLFWNITGYTPQIGIPFTDDMPMIQNTTSTNGGVTDAETIGGVISGVYDFTKDGSGRLTLAGNNTMTGHTIVQNGMLLCGQAGSLGFSLLQILSSSAYLNANNFDCVAPNVTYGGGASISNIQFLPPEYWTITDTATGKIPQSPQIIYAGKPFTAALPLKTATTFMNGPFTQSESFKGAISGVYPVTKSGNGLLNLSGDNSSFLGGLTIKQGTVQCGSDSALGTGAINLFGPTAFLDANGYDCIPPGLTYSNGASFANNVLGAVPPTWVATQTGSGAVVDRGLVPGTPKSDTFNLNNDITVSNSPRYDEETISGSITDNGKIFNFFKSGIGTLISSGSNAYLGNTIVQKGILRLVGSAAKVITHLVSILPKTTLSIEPSAKGLSFLPHPIVGGGTLNVGGDGITILAPSYKYWLPLSHNNFQCNGSLGPSDTVCPKVFNVNDYPGIQGIIGTVIPTLVLGKNSPAGTVLLIACSSGLCNVIDEASNTTIKSLVWSTHYFYFSGTNWRYLGPNTFQFEANLVVDTKGMLIVGSPNNGYSTTTPTTQSECVSPTSAGPVTYYDSTNCASGTIVHLPDTGAHAGDMFVVATDTPGKSITVSVLNTNMINNINTNLINRFAYFIYDGSTWLGLPDGDPGDLSAFRANSYLPGLPGNGGLLSSPNPGTVLLKHGTISFANPNSFTTTRVTCGPTCTPATCTINLNGFVLPYPVSNAGLCTINP